MERLPPITSSLHHSITPSLHYSITPSLHYFITPSLHYSITPLPLEFRRKLSHLPSMLLWREKIPDTWLPKIRADLPAVLVDHAHLERKAATSALNLQKYVELFEHTEELN